MPIQQRKMIPNHDGSNSGMTDDAHAPRDKYNAAFKFGKLEVKAALLFLTLSGLLLFKSHSFAYVKSSTFKDEVEVISKNERLLAAARKELRIPAASADLGTNLKQQQGPSKVDQNIKTTKLLPIHKQNVAAIAPNGNGEWDDEAVLQEFEQALQKIKQAEINHYPFDHFSVPNIFSDEFYKALMEELPPVSTYQESRYPGTDPTYKALHLAKDLKNRTHIHVPQECFKKKTDDHRNDATIKKRRQAGCWLERIKLHDDKAGQGRTLTVNTDASKYPLWVQAFRLVHSRNFTHLLYDKFATSTGIPAYKQEEVARQAAIPDANKAQGDGTRKVAKLRNTAALRIEPTSYHLTPHIDRYEKLVTWQYFHPESRELEHRNVGTQFYEVKPDFRDHFEMDDQQNPQWFDYSYFNPVKEQPVIPNYFFAFAPNNHSWHGAAIDPTKMDGVDQHARRTFLGFITTSYWGFHHFNKGDTAPVEFDFTSIV